MIPGLHSMDAEAYRSAAGVSRSDALWLQRSPFHFKAHIDGLIPQKETKPMRFGTIFHRSTFEPDTITEETFHVRPAGMKFTTKEGKKWRAEHSDKPILDTEEAEAIPVMRDSLLRDQTAARIIKSSDFERSAFAEDDGLLLKARFDALPKEGNIIADLKTIESADQDSVDKAVWDKMYFYQAAFYLRVANLIGLKRAAFILVFIEKKPPFVTQCYRVPDDLLRAGETLISRDLTLLRDCQEKNEWPAYGGGIKTAGVPGYALKRLEEIL